MKYFHCLFCSKENEFVRQNRNKYCDNKCQGEHRFLTETLPRYKEGDGKLNPRTRVKCVAFENGYKCVLCGNEGMHNGRPLTLQVDHIDGNAGNNMPSNLRLLCPNCHTQTDTYGSKNIGSGRGSRGLKRSS